MKNMQNKVSTLIEVLNSQNPEKYFKSKFQDFCVDTFFSEDEGAFVLEEDYQVIREQVEKSGIIKNGEKRELMVSSFAFGIFIFYSYTDFCMKTAYLTRRSMKRFVEKVSKNCFAGQFPKSIFDYYIYIKREGNSSLEQESIVATEAMFPFFADLSEFQFSFSAPKQDDDDDEDDDDGDMRNNANMIGVSIKNAYSCYINTICLSFSTFVNALNSLSIMEEIELVES